MWRQHNTQNPVDTGQDLLLTIRSNQNIRTGRKRDCDCGWVLGERLFSLSILQTANEPSLDFTKNSAENKHPVSISSASENVC